MIPITFSLLMVINANASVNMVVPFGTEAACMRAAALLTSTHTVFCVPAKAAAVKVE